MSRQSAATPPAHRCRTLPLALLCVGISISLAAPAWPVDAPADPATILQELEGMEIQILRADDELRGATARVRDAEGRLADQHQRHKALQASLAERRQRMALRIRTMYRFRHRGFLPLLFSVSSPHDLLRTARYLSWILRGDQHAVDNWEELARQQRRITRAIEAERKRLLQAAGEVFTRREDLERRRDERREMVAGVQRVNRRRVNKLLLEGREARLDVSLDLRETPEAKLEATEDKAAPPSFQRSKGRLPMPAIGQVRPTPRGVDILAEGGSEIRAVHGGTVSRLLQISGYGLVLILDHGQGWHTVYTHAEGFTAQVGQQVAAGEVVGQVGETGSLEGPRLHFEVRYQRASHDPLDWLRIPRGVKVLSPL